MTDTHTRSLLQMLRQIKNRLAALNADDLQAEYDIIERTYRSMLTFWVQDAGSRDMERILADLMRSSQQLDDRIQRRLRLQERPNDRYSVVLAQVRRNADTSSSDIIQQVGCINEEVAQLRADTSERISKRLYQLDKLEKDREERRTRLFQQVWTSDVWSKTEYNAFASMLYAKDMETYDKSLVISACYVSLLEMFDEYKMLFLLEAYLCTDAEVNQRAAVCLMILCRKYSEHIRLFPELSSRLSLQMEDPAFINDIFRIAAQLQNSVETETVSYRMRNDIMPGIMRGAKEAQQQNSQQQKPPRLADGENPEWFDNNDNLSAESQEKLKELTDLQFAGADVYMSGFAHMKGFPFFQELSHWLVPFRFDHPALGTSPQPETDSNAGEANGVAKSMQTLLQLTPFCSSDKYSFVLMMKSFGGDNMKQMQDNLESQLDGEAISSAKAEIDKERLERGEISKQFIFDLYRFHKLYPFKTQFENPFEGASGTFTPARIPIFNSLTSQRIKCLVLAEFLMQKHENASALELFAAAKPQMNDADADLWQKMGFCEHKLKHLEQSEAAYQTALDLHPDSAWTRKHLAQVKYEKGKYQEAEDHYDRLLEAQPDHMPFIAKKVECALQRNDYETALRYLHKAKYLDEQSPAILRKLYFVQMLNGEYEKALENMSLYALKNKENAAQTVEALQNKSTTTHTKDAEKELELQIDRSIAGIMLQQKGTVYASMKAAIDLAAASEIADEQFDQTLQDRCKALGVPAKAQEELRLMADAVKMNIGLLQ